MTYKLTALFAVCNSFLQDLSDPHFKTIRTSSDLSYERSAFMFRFKKDVKLIISVWLFILLVLMVVLRG